MKRSERSDKYYVAQAVKLFRDPIPSAVVSSSQYQSVESQKKSAECHQRTRIESVNVSRESVES